MRALGNRVDTRWRILRTQIPFRLRNEGRAGGRREEEEEEEGGGREALKRTQVDSFVTPG